MSKFKNTKTTSVPSRLLLNYICFQRTSSSNNTTPSTLEKVLAEIRKSFVIFYTAMIVPYVFNYWSMEKKTRINASITDSTCIGIR